MREPIMKQQDEKIQGLEMTEEDFKNLLANIPEEEWEKIKRDVFEKNDLLDELEGKEATPKKVKDNPKLLKAVGEVILKAIELIKELGEKVKDQGEKVGEKVGEKIEKLRERSKSVGKKINDSVKKIGRSLSKTKLPKIERKQGPIVIPEEVEISDPQLMHTSNDHVMRKLMNSKKEEKEIKVEKETKELEGNRKGTLGFSYIQNMEEYNQRVSDRYSRDPNSNQNNEDDIQNSNEPKKEENNIQSVMRFWKEKDAQTMREKVENGDISEDTVGIVLDKIFPSLNNTNN